MSKSLLMIFTRNPELGKVKTRLAKTIGNDAALKIYKFLLNYTRHITRELSCDKCIYYSVSVRENDIWDPKKYHKKQQFGNDLGERMKNAFNEQLKHYEKVIIIGSDMFQIKGEHIEKAFKSLDDHDLVIGPAQDGGYYLMGLKNLPASIFDNKAWGTSSVLENTMSDLKNHNVYLLDTLNDVDVYDDIKDEPSFYPFLKHLN